MMLSLGSARQEQWLYSGGPVMLSVTAEATWRKRRLRVSLPINKK